MGSTVQFLPSNNWQPICRVSKPVARRQVLTFDSVYLIRCLLNLKWQKVNLILFKTLLTAILSYRTVDAPQFHQLIVLHKLIMKCATDSLEQYRNMPTSSQDS
jgi:hypothetical protein